MIDEIIADRIHQARIDRNLTQKDMADMLNRTPSNFSDIERNRVSISAADLFLIAKKLEKPITFFYGDEIEEGLRNLIDLYYMQSDEGKSASLKSMLVMLALGTMAEKYKDNDSELSPEDLGKFFGLYLEFKNQINKMNDQVNTIGELLQDALNQSNTGAERE